MNFTIPMGVYHPGTSTIHRLDPRWKFAFLLSFIVITTIVVNSPLVAGMLVAGVAVMFALARIPLRLALSQLWPPLPFLLMIFAFQWWQVGIESALRSLLLIYAAIMLACLTTLTSTLEAMMEAMEKVLTPFARYGLPVETIVLAMSLTIRLLPLMLATVQQVLDARKARGVGFSLSAFATPVLIRSIRRAEMIGDALIARGVGDEKNPGSTTGTRDKTP